MVKLTDVYKEVRINKPTSQKEIFNFFIDSDYLWLLNILSESSSLEEFLDENYDGGSLEDYLDEYGYEDNIKKMSEMVNNYYKYFKKDDIYIIPLSDDMDFYLPKYYKSVKYITDNEDGSILFFHNL